ncbi:glycosyltransferase family 4 protein [Terrarubrum flagellatum]|uniref:glycosyltransferase family 4 protein n=1 Tax=Terrirubrum flagellatum TaxID=2895980 RepID=UPI0031450CB7
MIGDAGARSPLLNWFTPLPPARNGIADYAAMLLREIARMTPCVCYSEDPLAETPPGVEARDPMQAFRHLTPRSQILHQIGNNSGHVFALDALRRFGGVTSLHDLSLLYVHELGTTRMADLFGRMRGPAQALGDIYAKHWRDSGVKTAANYVLFDMVGEILSRSRRVIVHSEFARRKLAAVHGEQAASKISVIPHFAKRLKINSSRQARQELGIDPDQALILTSGFATQVKRFDWLIEALDELRRRGHRFRWTHAGEERASEYALSKAIEARPGLAEMCDITGYLSEEKLDCYIAAADIVINLRFPSVGENSGTLARAFSAGRCCIVNDTAAYAELPRDVVIHAPLFDTVGALVRALDRLLSDRSLRETFGQRARQFARTSLSIETVARQYLDAIRQGDAEAQIDASSLSGAKSPTASVSLAFDIEQTLPDLSDVVGTAANDFDVTLWFASADRFAETAARAPAMVESMIGPHIEIDSIRFVSEGDEQRVGLRVMGRACG